jgi:hypothetical protein
VAGVGDDGGDGLGGAVGGGGPDGDLVHVLAVEKLDVECLVEGGLDALGQLGEVSGEQGIASRSPAWSSRAGVASMPPCAGRCLARGLARREEAAVVTGVRRSSVPGREF